MKAVEADGSRFDRELWAELGSAGLLGLALPEEYDGAGLGLVELCRVLVEVGRTVAPVPLAAHGPASRLLAELGSDELKDQWLPGAASGELVLTAAVAEDRAFAPERPTTVAAADGDGFRLTGTKTIVPAGTVADRVPRARRDPRRAWRSSWSSPATRASTVTAQRFSDGDEVARLDLAGVAVSTARQVGAGRRLGRRAAAAPAAPRRRAPSSSASPRARWRSPRRTPRPASSSAARSAPSRRSRSGSPTATSTRSASG